MVKRSRDEITKIEDFGLTQAEDSDVWEKKRNHRSIKKQRFTTMSTLPKYIHTDSAFTNSENNFLDYKTAVNTFEKISGEESMSDKSHYSCLSDGVIVELKRIKLLKFPALFDGNTYCFLGQIYLSPAEAQLSPNEEGRTFCKNELLETDLYRVTFDRNVLKDVIVLPFRKSPRQLGKNCYIKRYHLNSHD